MSPSLLRLVSFSAVSAGFDAVLRAALEPGIGDVDGLRGVVAGRIGPGQEGRRLVATLWATEGAMVAAVGADTGSVLVHPETLPGTVDEPSEALPVAIAVEPSPEARFSIIRVVHGLARPGELDAYLRDAHDGVLRDRAIGEGPNALYLALGAPDRFVTMSLWGGWSHVETATGADHEHVDRTRHAERLATWSVDHYEVVPGLVVLTPAGRDDAAARPVDEDAVPTLTS